jgi:DNA topoisomerase IA
MEKDLDFMFRMFNNELTEEEERKVKELDRIRDSKKKSNNPYCACGGDIEGEEILSLDTH